MNLVGLLVAAGAMSRTAHAEEVRFVGVITRIKLADDGKSAEVTLKDNKSGNPVVLQIKDDLTLDKFKDHRIVQGDEIRVRYEKQADKNLSKSFLKTAGC